MKTVCRAVADRINDGAAPGDVVTAGALEKRVTRKEREMPFEKTNRLLNQTETPNQKEVQPAVKPTLYCNANMQDKKKPVKNNILPDAS
jgi:hypothetical protein